LFLIAKDPTKLQLWASVNEIDIGQIKSDMSVQFTVDALPNETFHGKVVQIRKNASMTNNVVTYTVVVSVDNPDGKLMPYMTANVVFEKVPSVKEPQKTDDKKPAPGNLEALDQQLKKLSAKCMAGQASIDEYLKAASPSNPTVAKNDSDNEESAKIRLKYAEEIFNYLDQQFQAGAVTQVERTKAKMARDIAAAEVKKDPLEAARAKVESTEKILRLVEIQFNEGGTIATDVVNAQRNFEEAKLQLAALLKNMKDEKPTTIPDKMPSNTPPTVKEKPEEPSVEPNNVPKKPEPTTQEDKKPAPGNLEALDQQLKELSGKCMAGQASIEEYLKAASSSDSTVAKNDSDSEESAKIRLKYAEAIFDSVDRRYKTGYKVTRLDWDKAKMARDIAAAELKKDPLEAARVRVEGTEKILKTVVALVQIGKATTEELVMAQRNFDEAKLQLAALLKDKKDEKPAETTKPIESAKPAELASPTEAAQPKE
jgi:transposase-like protein